MNTQKKPVQQDLILHEQLALHRLRALVLKDLAMRKQPRRLAKRVPWHWRLLNALRELLKPAVIVRKVAPNLPPVPADEWIKQDPNRYLL